MHLDLPDAFLFVGWGWWLGALIAAFSMVSYIVSRTVGLPGTEVEEWETVGMLSLAVEAGFLLVYALTLNNRRNA